MMKIFLTALLLIATTTFGVESIPARWHHGLSSTYLTEYAKGEHLVISDIWTGTLGSGAVVKHSLEVKIAAWDQPFTATYESKDKKKKEVLRVTLHQMHDPKEMKAEFEHTVYEDGKVVLKFSGLTVLVRLN